MKKIIILILFICLSLVLISHSAFADAVSPDGDSNWGIQPAVKSLQAQNKSEPSENIWNQERNNIIDEKYGSDESPEFLNREKMNQNETYDGYGGADGIE